MEETIKTWLVLSKQLSGLKEIELELRNRICEKVLKDTMKGSKTDTIGKFILTATAKTNKKVDKDLLKTLWSDLSKEEKTCFEFNPKLVEKNYKKIEKDSNLHRVIEEKPGTPSLKLKSIKDN